MTIPMPDGPVFVWLLYFDYFQYVDTMSKVLFSYFKSYSGRLMKLQVITWVFTGILLGVLSLSIKHIDFPVTVKGLGK
jgi:hypothetical protein